MSWIKERFIEEELKMNKEGEGSPVLFPDTANLFYSSKLSKI